jgi:proline iminopeptidase
MIGEGGAAMNRKHTNALLATAVTAAAWIVRARPRMLRWGATDEELRAPYPDAGIVPGGKRGATMAVTIEAPVSEVWPWLVQMGCDRAGWYSWDHLDNAGRPSAYRIHPEWQHIAPGDHLASTPSGGAWFEVAALEPEHFLGLRSSVDLLGRSYDPASTRPRYYSDSLWGFQLTEPTPGRTRLVVSGYAAARPTPATAIGNLLFWEPAHWIMQTRQFRRLKQRAELSAAVRA